MAKRLLYLIVTRDKYELPLAVGDNMADLARQTGRSLSNLSHSFSRSRRSGWKKGACREVWVDMEDDSDA